MQTNFSAIFYLKKPKGYASGAAPIYLRITVDGKRSEMSVGKTCLPEKWNTKAGVAIGTKEDVKILNTYLGTVLAKLHQVHAFMVASENEITAETLKNKLAGKAEPVKTIIPIFEEHNRKMEALVNVEYAPGTIQRFKTSLKHTIDFMQQKYNVSDIAIHKIDHAFITEYEFYLRNVRKCGNNSAVKYIKNFGKIINICLANGWINKSPFANYKSKVKEVERVFLIQEEIQALINKQFPTERLNQVRDIFLFSCFTGLAYIDARQLTKDNVRLGIDGGEWIFINRQKTNTQANIPLLPAAKAILDKYKDHPLCDNKNILLPILSNQKMNAYLKEIADLCGIHKELTFHIARHTFATTVTLTNGVPIESVSKMLGHKNLRITQHYAKIVDKKLSDDMKVLREKFVYL